MKKLLFSLILLGTLSLNIININAMQPYEYQINKLIEINPKIYAEDTRTFYLDGHFPKVNKNFRLKFVVRYKYNDINGKCVAVISHKATLVSGSSYANISISNAIRLDDHTINLSAGVNYNTGQDEWYGSSNVSV